MSEVEKMYENYNIKPKQKGYCDWGDYCPRPYNKCDDECPSWIAEVKYQPFTAEKQLELIKWLACKAHITIGKGLPWGQYDDDWWTVTDKKGYVGTNAYNLEEALANFVNCLWQILTEEERKQIKEILE